MLAVISSSSHCFIPNLASGNVEMVLTLYKLDLSCPARSAMMIIDLLGLEANFIDIDLMKGEHLAPEFVKINPLHAIPTLTDGDFSIGESNVIAANLVDKYGKDDSLYPKDLQKRALVDQRLFYNCGILYTALRNTTVEVIWGPEKVGRVTEERKEGLQNAYGLLEALIEHTGGPWLAGDHLTIADICTVTNASSADLIYPIDPVKFPKTHAWLQKCSELPTYQKYNVPGNEIFLALFRSHLKE